MRSGAILYRDTRPGIAYKDSCNESPLRLFLFITPDHFERYRSMEGRPPPVIKRDTDMPINVIGYSKPRFVMKKLGQCTATIAVNMAQQMRNAPILVNRPKKIRRPPINSPSASAPSQNHAGRKGNGANWVSNVHLAKPGPLKLPNTFCAPCAMKTIPNDNLSGRVDHVANVDVSLLIMVFIFRWLI